MKEGTSMIRTAIRLAALTALVVAVALPTAATAAEPGVQTEATVATVAFSPGILNMHNCDAGDFCAYEHGSFGGGLYAWAGSDSDWSNNFLNTGPSINNNDQSWWNRGNPCAGCDAVRVFDGKNFAAPRTICLTRGQTVSSLPAAAKRGSSHSWYGSC
jgi:hypothetical protein